MSGPRRIAAWAAAIPLLAGAAQSSAQEVRDAWFAETATAAGSSLEQLTNDRHQVFFITELLDLQGVSRQDPPSELPARYRTKQYYDGDKTC